MDEEMKRIEEIEEMVSKLDEVKNLERSELGEWWDALVALQSSIFDFGSETFIEAYRKELASECKRLKKEYRVVEKTVTRTFTYKELKHKSERDC